MTKSLTYVEIDIPAFSQNSPPDSPPLMSTFRFATDVGYLPKTIDAIPSLTSLKIDPAQISLGEDLGTRATVTATFRDHRHIFAGENFTAGSFWGKFRARYGLRLRGYNLRVITGALGQALADMEVRNYVIESTDGPSIKGEYKIIAKDVLKFADGDRAQCPVHVERISERKYGHGNGINHAVTRRNRERRISFWIADRFLDQHRRQRDMQLHCPSRRHARLSFGP